MASSTPETGPACISWRQLGVILFARMLVNAQFRIVYPFLPAISRGLGVPLETASLLVTVRALVGTSSPLFGILSDRYGRKAVMLAGLIALCAGAGLGVAGMSIGVVLAGFALLGLAKAAYDPAMQAYVGDTVPYERRGRVLGLIESSWATSWLIGVPAAGFLMARSGWHSPFLAVAGLAVLSLILTWRFLPASHSDRRLGASRHRTAETSGQQPAGWVTRSAVLALVVSTLVVIANENLFMVYGAWLEGQFGLGVTTLGLVSTVVSIAELVACGTAAAIIDRIGKRRALLGGLGLNIVAYLLLPRIAQSLGSALAGLVLLALTSEFCIVSVLPLVSELAPQARGTVMAINAAMMSIGVMVISVIAPRLWDSGGLILVTVVSAIGVGLAALLLWRGVNEAGAPASVNEPLLTSTGM